MLGLVSFVIVLSVLVFVHELGHFATAKLAKVRVEEFGFGYPPRMLKLGEWHGTAITLNWLPFGGFVRMAEDNPEVEGSLATKKRSTRAIVLAAGSLMNALLAVVLFAISYMMGTLTPTDGPGAGIYYVSPESPAEQGGLQAGDNILAIDGETITDYTKARDLIGAKKGQQIELTVERKGERLDPILVTPRADPPPNEGALGVGLDKPLVMKQYPIWEAVPMGFQMTGRTVENIFYAIRAAIRKQIPFQATGPIGIYQETSQIAQDDVKGLFAWTAFLSVNLFLFNLLPLPALDGGRLLFILLEWIRRGRRVPPEKEGLVHAVGMVALIALLVVISFSDVLRYFG